MHTEVMEVGLDQSLDLSPLDSLACMFKERLYAYVISISSMYPKFNLTILSQLLAVLSKKFNPDQA